MPTSQFSSHLLQWFEQHGRHDLPWQVKHDPYKVWVSEIMLQQTQVKTVLHYFPRFIERFPQLEDLAQASWDEVAPYWAGLGYYARARNLHKAAQQVLQLGDFPQDIQGWMALSGIGRSTAGALMSLGLGQFGVILDGNVKRVLSRVFAIAGDLTRPTNEKELWRLAESLVPRVEHAAYTQAIMDLGATICTPKKPLCLYCPMHTFCLAYAQHRVLDFPEKKAKKSIPSKQAHVLVIEYQQRWLWIKRDSKGIWGGLYALPIIEQEQEFIDLVDHYRLTQKAHGLVQHQFSHFTWQLQCHKFMVQEKQFKTLASVLHAHEFAVTDAQHMAIPTAMQKIIQQLSQPATC